MLGITENREITESHEVIPPGGPPPDPLPPRMLIRDVWPWLALLGILAIAGLLVWLFVLRDNGSKGVVVPAVVGMQQDRAIAKLTEDGFGVKAVIGPADRPRGIVVSQKPGGGSRLDKGQVVTINVSNGRQVKTVTATTPTASTTTQSTTTQAQTASVPDGTNQDLVSGAGQVEGAGFVAETRPDESATGAPGTVVAQDPAAGTDAPIGSVVVLSVATGANRPQVQVPNVVGQKSAAARAALLDAKLTARTTYKKGPASKVGIVLAQTPTGSVPAYTQVTLTVGS